jgi:hypothetical protein
MSKTIVNDPTGETYGFPTYRWGSAPKYLLTRRGLAAAGLRKNGRDPVAQMLRPRGRGKPPLVAYLYDSEEAAPRRPWTPAKQAAVQKAADSRKWCTSCESKISYVPRDGVCETCRDVAGPVRVPRLILEDAA